MSARAFKVVPGKQGEAAGEIGIEGTTIEAPTEVPFLQCASFVQTLYLSTSDVSLSMLRMPMAKAADCMKSVSSQRALLCLTTKQLQTCQQLVCGDSICDGQLHISLQYHNPELD